MELIEREKRIQKIKEEKHILEIQKKEQELKNGELIQKDLLAQKEKIQYQYAFLRAQINPHFLYNTLNVLFSQALLLSEDLANNIMKLSDLMRYSLNNVETENMKVSLQQEIDNLKTLIEIHHLRFSNSKFIDYTLNGDTENHLIPPLSIITVVENAFKYGELSNPDFPLIIKIVTTCDSIHFICKNKKKKNTVEILSNNLGLDNVSKRLDFAFKNKYRINITNDDDFYTFDLTIKK
ncbi:sensor histidine kinase [Flavobacterium muglaense]|nr:sensor histidine kinase [Flavobacterium muglaense]